MACVGCELKEQVSQLDVDALVQEQLSFEVDLAREEIRDLRLSICVQCEHLNQHTCGKCGCFVRFRASLDKKSCPDKKW
ncbi:MULTISPECIES: DUF6171 family protein [Niallia]|jgi:hypothetical protein|uniref:Uncharacterized protein n=1 Tax=Niallia circulans TaxID=1397 RepID=A0A268FBC2_NIACI|nr:DUF6171 family protein [Niallia circulans]ECD6517372.1 hypothetical protein [Salmonella enterica subsp. enterica serovar Paratyphi A]AYV69473.1 hypothetical protein C2I06_22935 [Niallia circulans]AYV72140.1 hypothetical protein C2H98_11460 [Niallia circulans]NRG26825.1 hypothetical protein [Niallia circulans]PAD82676.1 hypothetical protein CHH57_13560 [Niallia circulans]